MIVGKERIEISKPDTAILAEKVLVARVVTPPTKLTAAICCRAVLFAVRRATMTALIEFVFSVSQEEVAQTTIEAFCKKTGDSLIGRRVNDETHEVLLIVQLLHTVSPPKHARALSHTLRQGVIVSSRSVTCDLLKISLDPSEDLRAQMRDFPLRPGERWFSAIHDPHQAYVCMSRPLMLPGQAAWLVGHEAVWEFV